MATDPKPYFAIDTVLDHTNLARLLDELAEPAGSATRGRKWHCPVGDHDDQHASVTMHTDHRGHERWRCWSGDNSHRGDAVDLVQVTCRLDRSDAIEWLAHRAGLAPESPSVTPRPRRPPVERQPVPLDPAVITYVHACEKILWTTAGRPVRDWLHDRGFSDEILVANHVGADPGQRRLPRAKGLPWTPELAATFPALGEGGEVTYVQTRHLGPAAHERKYDNPSGRLGDNPRMGWTVAPRGPADGLLLVCEGMPDALSASQAGFRSVAVLGSQAPGPQVVAAISRRANDEHRRVVLIVDNDVAGLDSGERLRSGLAQLGTSATVLAPPGDGLDLNAWSQREPEWPARCGLTHPQPLARTLDEGHDPSICL